MKIPPVFRIGLFLLISCLMATAHDAAVRYKFVADQTNVFAVEVTVRSETGSETTSGNLFVVTKAVTTNGASISCRGSLKMENRRAPQRQPGYFPGYMPMQNISTFQNGCEMDLDDRGQVLRDGGDYLLAIPLGKLVQSIFEPLPAKTGATESVDTVAALDEPLWLGPTEFLLSPPPSGPPFYNGFMGYNQRPVQGALKLSRHSVWTVTTTSANVVIFKKNVSLASLLKTSGEPRLVATSESVLTYNRTAGVFESIETEGDVASQTETAARKAKVSFKCRLLTGAELAAALAPPQDQSIRPTARPLPRH